MLKGIEVSIVIPVYNSQDTIETVVSMLDRMYSSRFKLEIILVNDSSKDNSGEKCNVLSECFDNIVVIHHDKNYGQQKAIVSGLQKSRGKYIVLMDDDMQNPPSEVIKLIDKISEGFDVVIAKRHIYNQSWLRRKYSSINQKLSNICFKSEIVFTNFMIITNEVAQLIAADQSKMPVIQGVILKNKLKIKNITTEHHMRLQGKSNYSVLKLFKLWISVLTYFPLKFHMYTLFFMFIGITMIIYITLYF